MKTVEFSFTKEEMAAFPGHAKTAIEVLHVLERHTPEDDGNVIYELEDDGGLRGVTTQEAIRAAKRAYLPESEVARKISRVGDKLYDVSYVLGCR